MDNPKRSNQAKFSRSKKKKEHFKKNKNHDDENDNEKLKTVKSKESNLKGSGSVQGNTSTSENANSSKTEPSEPPKINPANLKKETEEIANLTQKYRKRCIVSAWNRDFEIPKYPDSDEEDGANFNELISGSSKFFAGNHFMLKEEQEWLKQAESFDSPFSLDLKCLENGISCIPFHIRQGLSEKSFSPKEIQIMINEAANNEINYKETKNTETNVTQKITLNNPNKNDDNNFIINDIMDDRILISMKEMKSVVDKFNDIKLTPEIKNHGVKAKQKIINESNVINKLENNIVGNCQDENKSKGLHKDIVECVNDSEKSFSPMINSDINNHLNVEISSSSSSPSQPISEYISLEPRSQRVRNRDRRIFKNSSKTNNNDDDDKSENIYLGSLAGLKNRSSVINNDKVKCDKTDSKFNNKSPDFNEYSFENSVDVENVWSINNDDEEIKLDLNCSKKSTDSDLDKNEIISIKDIESKNDLEFNIDILNSKSITNSKNNIIDVNLLKSHLKITDDNIINQEKVITNHKKINKNDDDNVLKVDVSENCNIPCKNSAVPVDGDDDLDFLLGLKEPTEISPSSTAGPVNSSSNLSILQEKLKVSGSSIKNKMNEPKIQIVKTENKEIKNSSFSVPDEDLDEWLDSVLES